LQVGWTQPDSSIGILALDRNGNDMIDDGSELFGTATKKRDGRPAAHGFDALLDLGVRPSNRRDGHTPSCCALTLSVAAFGDGRKGVRCAIEPEERIDRRFTRTGDTA
jgi:hypothetical protein